MMTVWGMSSWTTEQVPFWFIGTEFWRQPKQPCLLIQSVLWLNQAAVGLWIAIDQGLMEAQHPSLTTRLISRAGSRLANDAEGQPWWISVRPPPWNIPAYWTTDLQKGGCPILHGRKWARISWIWHWEFADGEELRSLLPNIPMVSKPLLTMELPQTLHGRAIIDRDRGCSRLSIEADPVRVYSSNGNDYAGSLCAGLLRLRITTFGNDYFQINPNTAGADWIGKPVPLTMGDMWSALSTPNVSLGGWIGPWQQCFHADLDWIHQQCPTHGVVGKCDSTKQNRLLGFRITTR